MQTIKFHQDFLLPVLQGFKTQTRRVIKASMGEILNGEMGIPKYQPGEEVAVLNQDEKQTGMTIEITGVHIGRLGSISDEELKSENMSREEYMDFMKKTYASELRGSGVKLVDLSVFIYNFKVKCFEQVPY